MQTTNKHLILILLLFLVVNIGCNQQQKKKETAESKNVAGDLDRTVLPIKEPIYPAQTELDARNAKKPERFEVTAPKGAPNVLVVLIDDQGFGVSNAFGGPVQEPVLDKMASEGLRYNNFNTTALCSPTRTAILTGYNHHSNNAGAIMEMATGFQGNTGIRPQTITPMAEVLRQNGYSTAMFGKYHETPPWEVSASGPYDRWPTHSGFDKFYGFLGGETNQWAPKIYDGVAEIETPRTPNYHFTTDMADHAINWIQAQQALTPDKPFFTYFATGATHAPHHAPKEYIAKYKGKFDMGWDKLREQTLARQIEMGIVPKGTKLAPKPAGLPDWDTLSAKHKELFARQMETFAGFAEHTDHEVGRLIDALREMGELDNTLVFYIVGDNGASAEGGMSGSFNELVGLNGLQENFEDVYKHKDEWGDPSTYPHFAIAWAVGSNAPFAWTKQVASDFGGTRNGVVVHWPNGIKAKNEIRSQFTHAIDIAPTVYEACKIPSPKVVNGIEQRPIEGTSMMYTFDDAKAPGRHTTQYFEMFGNRAIYHEGWVARTIHKTPWGQALNPLDKDVWQLFNVNEDFSEANDLAASNPEKLKELQALFLKEAAKYNVLPIDDRNYERFDAALAGRPDLMGKRTKLNLYDGMSVSEFAAINVKSKNYTITADVELPNANANGVVIAEAGRFGGWSLYFKNGKLHHEYNYFGLKRTNISSAKTLTAGHHILKYEFIIDEYKPGSGGKCNLYVDDQKVAESYIPKTQPFGYSADEGWNVGADHETPVSEDYKEADNKFTGKIKVVTVEIFPPMKM
ncbi:MAG: sulfatase-like hydrolase/transferase [Bacteroidetes bacterium]|nr:sulfatase-like hydrolase/transferase [Bacteroidota bacterium]